MPLPRSSVVRRAHVVAVMLCAVLVYAKSSAAASASAGGTPTAVTAGALVNETTLFASSAVELHATGSLKTSSFLRIGPATGWQAIRDGGNTAGFSEYWYKDEGNVENAYELTIDRASVQAALTGKGAVRVDFSLDGTGCDGVGSNAQVTDIALAGGNISRLDVSFVSQCDVREFGWVAGELVYDEPSAPVQSSPRHLLFPPNSSQTEAPPTVPVTLSGEGATVHRLLISGSGSAGFRMTHDGCTGAHLSSTTSCTVEVTPTSRSNHDVAELQAISTDGAVLSRTPLDGARLPGVFSSVSGQPAIEHAHRTAPTTANGKFVQVQGLAPGTREIVMYAGSIFGFEFHTTKPLHNGVYHPSDSPSADSWTYGACTECQTLSGTVRVRDLQFSRTDRGMTPLPGLELTYDLTGAAVKGHLYGSLVFGAAALPRLPGYVAPGRLTGVRGHRTENQLHVTWAPSRDVAVTHYVVRTQPGRHQAVGFDQGHLTYYGTSTTAAVIKHHRWVTATVYAVDDAGQHSAGATIIE